MDNYAQAPDRVAVLPRKYSTLPTSAIGGQEYLRPGTSLDALLARGQAISAEGAAVEGMSREFTDISFSYASAEDGAYAELPLYYYDGYRAEGADGAPLAVAEGENGTVRVALPRGGGAVRVRYSAPWTYRASELVSLAAAATCAARVIARRRPRAPR
jgi:hypothetical protein